MNGQQRRIADPLKEEPEVATAALRHTSELIATNQAQAVPAPEGCPRAVPWLRQVVPADTGHAADPQIALLVLHDEHCSIVWEPIIDARRILGPEGLAGSDDQLVGLGLRRLEEAKNWREVRDRLLDLHAIAHHELPVLPLWQMVDSYAYRRELIGVGSDIVALYQNAGNWRLGK